MGITYLDDSPATPEKKKITYISDEGPQWSDIPDNVVKGIKEAPEMLQALGKSLLTPWPMKAMEAVQGAAVSGKPLQALRGVPGAPIVEGAVDTARDYGAGELLSGDVSGAGQRAKTSIVEHPIKAAIDAATLAAPFLAPEAKTAQGVLENATMRAQRLAQQQALKAMEGTRGQIMQIGPEAARDLGQFALNKGIVSPLKGEIGMERALNKLEQEAGSQIGASRTAADLAGGAPDPSVLMQNIKATLEKKYGTGMRVGERGALKNALSEVEKIGKPSFVANAQKATEMNQYAKGLHQINQPSGALTDVANILSRENNAAIAKALTPEQLSAYKTALSDYGSIETLQEFFLKKESRELAGRGGGIIRGVKDAFGHKTAALAADKVAGLLSHPSVAKVLPALTTAAKMGPGALEMAHFMLEKKDRNYARVFSGKSENSPEEQVKVRDMIKQLTEKYDRRRKM
jgi:hypothetical protein